MLTDISSEMVAAVLPLYLVYSLGFTPLQYGVVDGLYQGASALVRLASGFTGDRLRRHKEVAATGYGLSAVCKLGLAGGGERLGRGRRDHPARPHGQGHSDRAARRPDLAKQPPETLGLSFGVHRALDTTGAMLGPLLAFGLLAVAPLAFDSIFLVSFCIAVVGRGGARAVRERAAGRPRRGGAAAGALAARSRERWSVSPVSARCWRSPASSASRR